MLLAELSSGWVHAPAGRHSSAGREQATQLRPGVGRPVWERIPEVIDEVVAVFNPVRVIVFGSVVRREERPESDLDLLVLFDHLPPEGRRSLMGKIRGAIRAPIPINVLVASVTEYEALEDVNGSPYY